MPFSQSTYHSRVFRDFKEIEPNAYRQVIRFYEEHEDKILSLDMDEKFEMLVAYVDALFEIGAYQKHLLLVDYVIEISIKENIQQFQEQDIFQHMLFRKAASLYNCVELEQSDYILRELIRINPQHPDAVLFLKKCLRRMRNGLVYRTRAASISLFLLTAFVICLEVLFVRPFYQEYTYQVEAGRNYIFLFGCLVLLGGDLVHRWRVEREVDRFVEELS